MCSNIVGFALVLVLSLCPCNILMVFFLSGNSSCIIFAVVRSTLLVLHLLDLKYQGFQQKLYGTSCAIEIVEKDCQKKSV